MRLCHETCRAEQSVYSSSSITPYAKVIMRRLAPAVLIVVAAACAKPKEETNPPADSAAVAAAPATLTAADMSGTWKVTAKRADNDSTVAGYTLWASADTSQWKMKFDTRNDTMRVHVTAMGGDSISTHVGPYESVLRKGVKVQTTTPTRLQNGAIVGTGAG